MSINPTALKRNIKIQFLKEGLHRYPRAATDEALESVKYLGDTHFHYFYFYVTVQVFHNDRDLEFQMFRRWCESLYRDGVMEIDFQSCEMLSENLINQINDKYPGRDITVEVYEDNINGAVLHYSAGQ